MSDVRTITFCLAGNSAVGKTSVINRYVHPDKPFNFQVQPTIGLNYHSKTVQVKEGKNVKVQVIDPSGQEQFHSLTKNFYQNASGVILVYAINDRDSFERMTQWIEEAKDYAPEGCQFILIANKKDLSDNDKNLKSKDGFPMYRDVNEEEEKKLLKNMILISLKLVL